MALHFYKIMTKVAHWHGAGKNEEVPIYIYGRGLKDAMQMVKRLPMVKHQNLPLSSVVEVTEKEFVIGNMKNAYEPYKIAETSKVVSLDNLSNRLWHLFEGGYRFEEPEGRQLKDYYTKYLTATKKQQKQIDEEYMSWAMGVISEPCGEDEM